jgi:transcriptional regulator with XRE-family HTH domain
MLEAVNKSINVKDLRERKKLSRVKVAAALDVAEMTVRRWEQGVYRPHVSLEKIQAMLELFDCDFPTLYQAFEQTWQENQHTLDNPIPKTEDNIPVAV